MRRAVNEIVFHGILVLVLIGLWLASRPHHEIVALSLLAAGVLYPVLYLSPLRWTMPRRRRHVPAFAVCFLGAFLVSLASRELTGDSRWETFAAALSGAFAFLYVAVKSGTPTHVSIVVNAGSVSSHRNGQGPDVERGRRIGRAMKDLGMFYDDKFDEKAFGVWPEHFEVAQEGSVAWFINGAPGTIATIRFSEDFDPFDDGRGPPSVFRGEVPEKGPGIIVAGPVVRPGRGAYSIEIAEPSTDEVKVMTVRGGGSQRKG